MNRPFTQQRFTNTAGLSSIEVVIVLGMACVVVGFAWIHLARAHRAASRDSAALEIANYLRKARLDSMRRNARDVSQMAQLKIFNRSLYSVAIDGDGDGYLDVPLVLSLPTEKGVEINGPFPKTFIFDWLGQTVDSQSHRVAPPLITIGNGPGAGSVRFRGTGDIVVVPVGQ